MVVVGGDLLAEVAARCLGAAGVGCLRWALPGGTLPPAIVKALLGSNPELRVQPWPSPRPDDPEAWVALLEGAAVAVRSGFDQDALLGAAVRTGIPLIVARSRRDGRGEGADLLSFRRHGPCPHAPLDGPVLAAAAPPAAVGGSGPGAMSVVAAHAAAAEALALISGAATGGARARLVKLSLDPGTGGGAGTTVADLSIDLPWAPECFACGGAGAEMSFS